MHQTYVIGMYHPKILDKKYLSNILKPSTRRTLK